MASRDRSSSSILGDDDYWASSRIQKATVRLNLFDESVALGEARKCVMNMNTLEDDENEEVVNWDDSPFSAVAERISQRTGSVIVPKPADEFRTRPSSISGVKFAPNIDGDKELDVDNSRINRMESLGDKMELKAEVGILKSKLEHASKSNYEKVPVEETVKRIIYGLPYCLEIYHSLEDKVNLLDTAIRLHDGNAILAAVLFLRDTIKRSLFNFHLQRRPAAVNHLISYLRDTNDWKGLADLYGMMDSVEEEAMLMYKQAVVNKSAESKVKSLKNCSRTHFQSNPVLLHEAGLIQEQISLLERQLVVETSDSQAEAKGDPRFRKRPRATNIVDKSVITMLYYACLYHYEEGENLLSSPISIRKAHKLTDKQYTWAAMSSRASLGEWADVENLFKAKAWFGGGTKMKAVIGFDKVVIALNKLSAPRTVKNNYCKLIADVDLRIQVALGNDCPETVIDTYVQQKDRKQLRDYFNTLKAQTQEWYYANDSLSASTVKWKN